MLVGLLLFVLGAALILCSFVKTNVDTVIDTSFAVAPGAKHEPYEEPGTYYHTRVYSKSTLRGEIFVEGGGIYLTVRGHNTQALGGIYIERYHSFEIDPADDQYTFAFDNTQGVTDSVMRFVLIEEWRPMAAILRGFGLCLLLPIGVIIVVISCWPISRALPAGRTLPVGLTP